MEQACINGRRILVVEDEPGIAQVCVRTLSAEGFEMDTAVNGEAALDLLGRKDYTLCLIDIRIPQMNGIELFRWIEENHPHLAGKVIFTTGDTLSGNTKEFLEQADNPFLAKPFTPDELRTIVRRVSGLA